MAETVSVFSAVFWEMNRLLYIKRRQRYSMESTCPLADYEFYIISLRIYFLPEHGSQPLDWSLKCYYMTTSIISYFDTLFYYMVLNMSLSATFDVHSWYETENQHCSLIVVTMFKSGRTYLLTGHLQSKKRSVTSNISLNGKLCVFYHITIMCTKYFQV